jgi:histidine phosphotransferase ChpT
MAGDLELAELVAARLCHDLVGPIGAVANGIELLGDGGGAPDPEVVGLIAASAGQAARRLQWFRIAFGSGAALPAGSMFAEARRLASGLLADGRVTLDWPAPDAAVEAAATRAAAKLVLNLGLVALESLPRGGTIQVRLIPSAAALNIVVGAAGTGAKLLDDLRPALADGAALGELAAKAMPAYLAARLVALVGCGSRST